MAETKKKTTKPLEDVVEKTEPVYDEAYSKADELVRIKLPKEREDQEDKVVWVNDRRFLIKKGVPVDVPRCVADILEQEENMLQIIFDYEEKKQTK